MVLSVQRYVVKYMYPHFVPYRAEIDGCIYGHIFSDDYWLSQMLL